MKKISLAIFDLDGTILDSNGVWDDIDRRFLDSINQPWDEEFAKMVAQSDYHKAGLISVGINDFRNHKNERDFRAISPFYYDWPEVRSHLIEKDYQPHFRV